MTNSFALCLLAGCTGGTDQLGRVSDGGGGQQALDAAVDWPSAPGGTTGSGGSTVIGGSTGAGGTTQIGGATGAGGSTATGGATRTGGSTLSGGSTGTGGRTGTGGTTGTGGHTGAGGTPATGGVGGGGGYDGGVFPACTYADTTGTVTIRTIQTPPSSEYNCPNNAKKVIFDFVPDDPNAVSAQDQNDQITIGAGMNPPESCLQPNGISVGAQLPAIRENELTGSCSPLVWKITLPNLQLCTDECWRSVDAGQDVGPSADAQSPAGHDVGSSGDTSPLAELCTTTGGLVSSGSRCLSVGDFPNDCLVGACAPSSSHTVSVCTCSTTACFLPAYGCAGPTGTCTVGSDQTCNDNLSASSLYGRCVDNGRCVCNRGFSLLTSGKCQPIIGTM